MVKALFSAGIFVVFLSFISGFRSGSFLGFIISIIFGIVFALLFFALAMILDNQEEILFQMQKQESNSKLKQLVDKKVCPRCEYKYDSDRNSCPNCGLRN